MTERHTPGPWQYRPNEYDDWGFVRALPLPGENIGHIVAVAKDTSVPFEAYDEYRERKADPFEANARLIAAAPDMLDALHKAREWLEGWGSAERQLDVINEAISKAEGRLLPPRQ